MSDASYPVLSCDAVSSRYGGSLAVNNVNLTLKRGQMIAVLGANGAGKSSFVNALAGWSRGTPVVTGTISLEGADISCLASHERARRGVLLVSESRNVFANLTVMDHFLMVNPPKENHGRFVLSNAEVYDLFPRLAERRSHKGSQLSGGERQMLAVSCALMAGPRALLLDEPSIGLAPLLIQELLGRIRSLVDLGLSVVLVEQNATAALGVADHAILLERGREVAAGPASELRSDPKIAAAYLGIGESH